MIHYRGYLIKKSKVVRNGFMTKLKHCYYPYVHHSDYKVIKYEIDNDIRGKQNDLH